MSSTDRSPVAPEMTEPGREMDAMIAEKVMGRVWPASRCPVCGWSFAYVRVGNRSGAGCVEGNCSMRPAPKVHADEPAPYSTEIRAAMEVVAAIQRQNPGWRFSLLGGDVSFGYIDGSPQKGVDESRLEAFGWIAEFHGHIDPRQNYGDRHGRGWADTAPLAICLAALEATRGR